MRALRGLGLVFLAAGLPAADVPSFEAASVKSAKPDSPQIMRGGPGTGDPGQFSYSGAPLGRLIQIAYGVKAYQLSGPPWIGTEKFEIVAKVPAGTTKEQFGSMLQSLLADRFGLKLHHQTRRLMGYELKIGKNGHKLKPAVATPYIPDKNAGTLVFFDRDNHRESYRLTNGLVRSAGQMQTLSDIVTLCENHTGLPVVDKTRLTGQYDYSFDYAADPPATRQEPASTAAAIEPGPDFVAAFQKQLGFKLEKKKVPIDVLLIDRANKVPAEN